MIATKSVSLSKTTIARLVTVMQVMNFKVMMAKPAKVSKYVLFAI